MDLADDKTENFPGRNESIREKNRVEKGYDHLKFVDPKVSELQELTLAYLNARDSAIGAAAELGEMRFRLEKATTEIDSLVNQLNLLHGSRTWRAGRFLLLPLRAVRKIIRLLTD
jgi:hypothetical protein